MHHRMQNERYYSMEMLCSGNDAFEFYVKNDEDRRKIVHFGDEDDDNGTNDRNSMESKKFQDAIIATTNVIICSRNGSNNN